MDGASLVFEASNGDKTAIKAFQIFAQRLGHFLVPHIKLFNTDLVIIGGTLAQAWYLIEDVLNTTVNKFCNVRIYFSLSYEKSICLGAIQQHLSILFQPSPKCVRKTSQNLLPVTKTIDTHQYNLYPCHHIPIGYIGVGHKELNEEMFRLIEQNQILLIDGFVGAYFDEYADELNKYYNRKVSKINLRPLLFYDARAFLKVDLDNIKRLYLHHSQSIFSKVNKDLDFKRNFVDLNKLNYLKNNLSHPCVIIGPGASFVNDTSPLIYIDLAKNELFYRVAAKTSFSYLKPMEIISKDDSKILIDDENYELTTTLCEQKYLYFLDYPVFNKLKQELLSRMTFFVDSQRPKCPTWIHGHTFRQALTYLATLPIRTRPWFKSDSWDSQWLKSIYVNFSQSSRNYAWSLEMITPDNGILLSDENHHLLELSLDLLYGSQADRILGNDYHYRLFGDSNDFPIRFDLLDTVVEGNTTIHFHPNVKCIRTNFGEKLTQDETYYTIETKHSKEEYQYYDESSAYVYLAFQDNVNPGQLHMALRYGHQKQQKLNGEKCSQRILSNIHDLFLILNEKIHATTQNQGVLRISTAHHINQLKLNDWLKLDLNGNLRILNSEHAMENLNFDRCIEKLRCQSQTVKFKQDKHEEQHLPTHNIHVYDVKRLIIEPNESISIKQYTENRFHLCVLVEGDTIEIEFSTIDDNQQKQVRQYNYLEAFLIPASITEYYVRPLVKKQNNKKKPLKFILLISFLKWDCEK